MREFFARKIYERISVIDKYMALFVVQAAVANHPRLDRLKNKNYITVLGTVKSKFKALADLLLCKSRLSGLQMAVFPFHPSWLRLKSES